MKPMDPTAFRNSLFLTAWGMITLILIVCVAFLVLEMRQQGYSISPLSKSPTFNESLPSSNLNEQIHQVNLYFGDLEKNGLVAEERHLKLSNDIVTNCRIVLEAIIEGPKQPMAPVLNQGVRLRAVYLEDSSNLVVDFSREIELERNSSPTSDWIMVQSLVNSVVQESIIGIGNDRIQSLRILVEGAVPYDNFPYHIDVSDAIKPEQNLLLDNTPIENRV
jgi:hypothetical protein